MSMQDIDEKKAAQTRRMMGLFMNREGAVRQLALASGLSEQTIRTVASTGVVSSMRTAKALEAATDGAIPADEVMQPSARGKDVYSKFPGSEIMKLAISRRCAPRDLLVSVGITHQDLSIYMHNGDDASAAVRNRVGAALQLLSLSAESASE